MTARYVGTGGNDGNSGLSWALRKLTLNGVEDTPVVAGDIVYVGPGVYRETLTLDVSGTAGNVISYIGDYDGSHTDGVGGIVRITGSDDDLTATRTNCILASGVAYRTISGLLCDLPASRTVMLTNVQYVTVEKCVCDTAAANSIYVDGASQSHVTIQQCVMIGRAGTSNDVLFAHSSTINDSGHVVQNCLFLGSYFQVRTERVGGITVSNCTGNGGYRVGTALAAGQTMNVKNCLLNAGTYGFYATTLGELVEDYNNIYQMQTARTNTNVGAHSTARPLLPDMRWAFEIVYGGSMVTPYDLASYSTLIDMAGSSPTTTDIRGTSVQGTQRELGALEYLSTLSIEAGAAGGGFPVLGGSIVR